MGATKDKKVKVNYLRSFVIAIFFVIF